MFHTLYNVATLTLLIAFVPLLAKLMQTIIPVREDEAREIHERRLIYLDEKNLHVPSLAVTTAQLEIIRMAKIARESLRMALESFFEKNADKANMVLENEKTIDFLHQGITSILVEITNLPLSRDDAKKIGDMFVIVSDIEQIGDHAENIAEYTLSVCETERVFSEVAIEELQTLRDITLELVDSAFTAYEQQDSRLVPLIQEMEDNIDETSSRYAKNHFRRLKAKTCKPKSGVIYMDIVNDLEKTADNAENIALTIM